MRSACTETDYHRVFQSIGFWIYNSSIFGTLGAFLLVEKNVEL